MAFRGNSLVGFSLFSGEVASPNSLRLARKQGLTDQQQDVGEPSGESMSDSLVHDPRRCIVADTITSKRLTIVVCVCVFSFSCGIISDMAKNIVLHMYAKKKMWSPSRCSA